MKYNKTQVNNTTGAGTHLYVHFVIRNDTKVVHIIFNSDHTIKLTKQSYIFYLDTTVIIAHCSSN